MIHNDYFEALTEADLPEILQEIASVIGLESAIRFWRGFEGHTLKIPRVVKSRQQTAQYVVRCYKRGLKPQAIAKNLCVEQTTVYRILKTAGVKL